MNRLSVRRPSRFCSVLVCASLLSLGCDQVAPPSSPAPSTGEGMLRRRDATEPIAETEPEKPPVEESRTPEQLVAAFRESLRQPSEIDDGDLEAFVQSLGERTDVVTELDLTATSITGAALPYVSELRALRDLKLADLPGVSGADLVQLQGLELLETLSLERTPVGSGALTASWFEGLPSLKELNLNETGITDADFEALRPLGKLEVLRFSHTNCNGQGFWNLRKGNGLPKLRVVEANETEFGDYGFAGLMRCEELRELSVVHTRTTDSSLRGLKGCRNLEVLDLDGNQITSQGVKILGTLKSLKTLRLSGNEGVDDLAFNVLKGNEKLELLDVDRTNCTAAAVQLLKRRFLAETTIFFAGRRY